MAISATYGATNVPNDFLVPLWSHLAVHKQIKTSVKGEGEKHQSSFFFPPGSHFFTTPALARVDLRRWSTAQRRTSASEAPPAHAAAAAAFVSRELALSADWLRREIWKIEWSLEEQNWPSSLVTRLSWLLLCFAKEVWRLVNLWQLVLFSGFSLNSSSFPQASHDHGSSKSHSGELFVPFG